MKKSMTIEGVHIQGTHTRATHRKAIETVQTSESTDDASVLRNHLEQIHTTELGVVRIKRNLSLDTDDVVELCKEKIQSKDAVISRNGKNWYVLENHCIWTINAYSYTIITAHKEKR